MKRLCIKLGGRLLTDAQDRHRMAEALARAFGEGDELLLVHGGGAQLGEACAAMGLPEKKHEGLRITDRATARVATWVLAGEVNKTLVHSLTRLGLPALGLCGADLGLFGPRRKELPCVDLGYVGELSVEDVDAHKLDALIQAPSIPVLATMGPDPEGEENDPFLNVNADEAASPIAAAAQADELLLLSDVEGVRGPDGNILTTLDREQTEALMANGIIAGGMIPKIRAAWAALHEGVPSVRIASGEGEDPIQAALAGGGTQLVAPSTSPQTTDHEGADR